MTQRELGGGRIPRADAWGFLSASIAVEKCDANTRVHRKTVRARLEEAVGDAGVQMGVAVEARAEAVQEGYGTLVVGESASAWARMASVPNRG